MYYEYEKCVQQVGTTIVSKNCTYHAHPNSRTRSCNALLLKKIHLRSGKIKLIPFNTLGPVEGYIRPTDPNSHRSLLRRVCHSMSGQLRLTDCLLSSLYTRACRLRALPKLSSGRAVEVSVLTFPPVEYSGKH